MRFDTRDKKPTLYDLLILTIAVALLLTGLIRSGGQDQALAISLLLDGYFLSAILLLMSAFFRQLQYNPYSYNTIYYMGFSLFILSVLITHVILTVRLVQDPASCRAETSLLTLLHSARSYVFLTAPFLAAFSVALCLSNLSLIRHEGRRPVNLLGILLSFLLVAGEVFLFWQASLPAGESLGQIRLHELCGCLFAAVYLYFECMLLGVMVASAIVVRYEPDRDKDFLIVLGCGLRKDGTPTPLLRGRLDRALAFAKKQKEETGRDLIFVTSGGQGPNEVVSESASMKGYLMEQGVPAERIVEEDRSADTMENMQFSKEKILQVDPAGKVAFATTNYHVFRSGLCARRVKMRAVGMGAPTRWYFWPNASVREFVGLLTEHRGKQALIFGSLLVMYILLTFLTYR